MSDFDDEEERVRRSVDAQFPIVAAFLEGDTAPHTVTVQTGDHGPVTIPVPPWCKWTTPGVSHRSDICHFGEEKALVVGTLRSGDVRVAAAHLIQWPFSILDRQVRAAVELDVQLEYDAASLAGLLDALAVWIVGPMHDLHEQLQRLEGGAS